MVVVEHAEQHVGVGLVLTGQPLAIGCQGIGGIALCRGVIQCVVACAQYLCCGAELALVIRRFEKAAEG